LAHLRLQNGLLTMNYLSVCSGIEAATCAWHDLGWTPEAFSEIEKFPSEVLAHHYPAVPNLGDMTKFKEWSLEPIDLLVGGTPCQSFSVAGLRKGLDDPRGNLALVYLAIADRFKPKWLVWENVPGVLSSNGGRDFGSFLGALAQLGYGFSYRVLDAQYFGVAQRRRRVFVVGYLGDWRPAAAVLFESESLRGDSPPSRETREEVAGRFVPSVANCLETTSHDYSRADGFCMMTEPMAFHASQDPDVSGSITAPLGAQTNGMSNGILQPAVAVDSYNLRETGDISQTIKSPQGGVTESVGAVRVGMAVRRLTPTECERLQGFPDGYTDVRTTTPDGPRYKALGNSMAVPVMKWIGERIKKFEELNESTNPKWLPHLPSQQGAGSR
jgi:DNA (cytosine-5)-methyltransferase 1